MQELSKPPKVVAKVLIYFVHHQNTKYIAIEKLAESRFPEKFCLNIEAEDPSPTLCVYLKLWYHLVIIYINHIIWTSFYEKFCLNIEAVGGSPPTICVPLPIFCGKMHFFRFFHRRIKLFSLNMHLFHFHSVSSCFLPKICRILYTIPHPTQSKN